MVTWTVKFLILFSAARVCDSVATQVPHPLWNPTGSTIASEYVEITGSLILQNPCEFLARNIAKDYVKEALATCNLYNNEIVLSELDKWCPLTEELSSRQKREIITAAELAFSTIVSVGLGATATVWSYMNSEAIETLQESVSVQEQMLADVERQVLQNDKRIREITQHFNKLASELLNHQREFDLMKKTLIGTTFGISRVISQFTVGQRVLQESRYLWAKNKVNPHFFNYFNISLPFISEVPLEMATPVSCEMKDAKSALVIKFRAPRVSNKFTLLKADPFKLMVKEGTDICEGRYTGPAAAIVSSNDTCIHAFDPIPNSDGAIFFSAGGGCLVPGTISRETYVLENCKKEEMINPASFQQVKHHGGSYYVYCPMSTFSLKNLTAKPCPKDVMVIPSGNTVTIDGHQVIQAVNHTNAISFDPLVLTTLQESLTHSFNWSSLELPNYTPLHPLDTRQYHPIKVYSMTGALLICAILITCMLAYFCVKRCSEKENTQWRANKNGELVLPQIIK